MIRKQLLFTYIEEESVSLSIYMLEKVGKPTAYVMPEDTNPNRIPRQEKTREKILILSAATENKS